MTRDAAAPHESAAVVESGFGEPASWEADPAWYARAKARAAWREQASVREMLAGHPPAAAARRRHSRRGRRLRRWLVVAASAAQPGYDHAAATCTILLIGAAMRRASATAASEAT
jgi:hypothetical protein